MPNSTDNATSYGISSDHANDPTLIEASTYAMVTLSLIILVTGVIGNTAVLTVFRKGWKRRKICELFMINLAVSDLMGSVIIPMQAIIEFLQINIEVLGEAGCRLLSFVSTISVSVSAFTIVAITIDRFVVIALQHREVSYSIIVLVNIGIWILGSLSGAHSLIAEGVTLSRENNVHVCRDNSSVEHRKIHFLLTCSFQVIIPLLTITILSLLIAQVIKSSAKNSLLKHASKEFRKRARRSKRAIKLVYAVVVAFFLCHLPLNIFVFSHIFKLNSLSYSSTLKCYYILYMLQMTNTCMNPLIYGKLHQHFKTNTWLMFQLWIRRLLKIDKELGDFDTKFTNVRLNTEQTTPKVSRSQNQILLTKSEMRD